LDATPFSLPRHHSSIQLLAELPDELLRTPFVWLRHGRIVPPLHRPYDSRYDVVRWGPRSFTIRVRSRDEIISVSRLKACMQADATPGSPRCRGRPLGKRPGGPATTKRVSFADPLVSPPSLPQAPPSDGPGTVFPVAEPLLRSRTSFCMPWTGGVIPASTAAVPALSAVTTSEIGLLTSPPAGRR
jgi:hypothetical protein